MGRREIRELAQLREDVFKLARQVADLLELLGDAGDELRRGHGGPLLRWRRETSDRLDDLEAKLGHLVDGFQPGDTGGAE